MPLDHAWFAQRGFDCRFDWGPGGAQRAADRGDVLIIVDVLRFSTSVAAAIARGAEVYPCGWDDDPALLSARFDAVAAVPRPPPGDTSLFSLSPRSCANAEAGQRIVLASPNGAVCSRHGATARGVYAGALVNAEATARAAARCSSTLGVAITVVACGERGHDAAKDGELRFAVEDYVGAGAVIHSLGDSKSPEARACEGACLHLRADLRRVLEESGSGQELSAKGWTQDVLFAARLDAFNTAAVLRDGWFKPDR